MTEDEKRILEIEARVRSTIEGGTGRISNTDFEMLLNSRLAWKFAAMCYANSGTSQEMLIREAVEYVRHAPDCRSIGGNGDDDCTCGAVAYLKRLFDASGVVK